MKELRYHHKNPAAVERDYLQSFEGIFIFQVQIDFSQFTNFRFSEAVLQKSHKKLGKSFFTKSVGRFRTLRLDYRQYILFAKTLPFRIFD